MCKLKKSLLAPTPLRALLQSKTALPSPCAKVNGIAGQQDVFEVANVDELLSNAVQNLATKKAPPWDVSRMASSTSPRSQSFMV